MLELDVNATRSLVRAFSPSRAVAILPTPFSPDAEEYRFWFVDRLRDCLKEQHGSLNFNLKSECASLGQKASTASAHFKRRYAMTIRDYGLRLRMEYALTRLERDPDVHLGELARELGYSRENAFSRVFHSYWRLSPRDCALRAVFNRL
jgi:AraC-like DNA-binding protein